MAGPCTWSLVVVTYNRGPSLRRCLALAVAQTRPPQEIVVVDASPNWQDIRAEVMGDIASRHPEIRWEYVEARVRSMTAQRNQAIGLATSDVLFLIDDDSFMYPDCAAEVMKVYDADRRGLVAGVNAMLADEPPDAAPANNPPDAAAGPEARPGLRERLTNFFERELETEKLLLPYDRTYPDHALPAELKSLDVAATRYLHGMRMTYRREPIRKERFEEFLHRYAAAEDLDASYRVSRHGALVNALQAQLYHERAVSGRLSRYTCMVLTLMNLAVLYRLKGYNPKALLRAFRGRVLRRLCVDFLRDLAMKRFSLPCSRADCYALTRFGDILAQDEQTLRKWYPSFQNEMNERNPS
jgi:GT2 family glycosyltransferase